MKLSPISQLVTIGWLSLTTARLTAAQTNDANDTSISLRRDNGTFGPAMEVVHYYYDQWPIGLAVSSTGRKFACYTRGDYTYTVGELNSSTTEVAFPSRGAVLNLPPSQLNTSFNGIPFGSGNSSALVSVQALIITNETPSRPETLWMLDTGRPTVHDASGAPSMPYAQPGGAKVLAVNLTAGNDTVYRTYTFPATVYYPDSFFNDIRVDLRPSLSGTTGDGVAYLVDSSNEGRNGIIVLDLGSGASWRRLSQDPSVLRVQQNVPSYVGRPFYLRQLGMPIGYQQEGLDGIQLNPDGSRLYYSPLTSTTLYSVPTANLRVNDSHPLADLMAHSNVSSHGQRGADANGFEGDSHGRIYQLMPTQNAIYFYHEADLQTHGWVRDPRILWADSANVGQDGYLYFNVNQLFYQPDWNAGIDGRQKPGFMARVKLPDGAGKINLA